MAIPRTVSLAAAVVIAAVVCGCATTKPARTTAPAGPVLPEFVIPSRGSSPFSAVVRVGNLLYISGQLGTDSTGVKGVGAETTRALQRIGNLLTRAGSSMDRVAKCTVMLADMNQWEAMNAAYVAFFPGPKPARSSFGATGLAFGALVEIECIATVD